MRRTVSLSLPSTLIDALRAQAAERGVTPSSLAEGLLRQGLASSKELSPVDAALEEFQAAVAAGDYRLAAASMRAAFRLAGELDPAEPTPS